MTRQIPPNPKSYAGDMKRWAEDFFEFYLSSTEYGSEADPQPVLLPHRVDNVMERATTDGIVLYDPVLDQIVYSVNGEWIPLLGDGDVAISQFNELIVAERTPLIELSGSYPLSEGVRDIVEVAGSGSVTSEPAEFLLSTGATASSTAVLEAAERGRYVPGFAAEVGIGVRIPTAPTGNQELRWGGTTNTIGSGNENGFYFGQDATGVFVAYNDNGTETKVYQSNWNIDKLDGTGRSGVTLDTANGNIYQIEFTYYGYGDIVFSIVKANRFGRQKPIKVHAIEIDGSASIEDPNLYLFGRADNGGDASNIDLYVGGRSYTIIGRYQPEKRITGQDRAGVSVTASTPTPIVSFRRKSAFERIAVRAQGFEVDVATEPIVVELILNGTLTGASWATPTNHNVDETAVEADVSATAISGGTVIFTQYFPDGLGGQSVSGLAATALSTIEIPRQWPITLAARKAANAGGGNATVYANFKVNEEW